MIAGEYKLKQQDIELNVGRKTITLVIANTGDRPIQVGSHYHFAETNKFLDFDRQQALGFRLNIAAGTAVRFEPGQTREVELVEYAGTACPRACCGAAVAIGVDDLERRGRRVGVTFNAAFGAARMRTGERGAA